MSSCATISALQDAIREERDIVVMPLFRQTTLLHDEETKRVHLLFELFFFSCEWAVVG